MGDQSIPFVMTGNATVECIAEVLIPMARWLFLWYLIENPAASSHSKMQSIQSLLDIDMIIQIVLG